MRTFKTMISSCIASSDVTYRSCVRSNIATQRVFLKLYADTCSKACSGFQMCQISVAWSISKSWIAWTPYNRVLQWIIPTIATSLILVEYTFKNNSDHKLVKKIQNNSLNIQRDRFHINVRQKYFKVKSS